MGVSHWTICRDCDAEAPELGDHGYLGYPSLDDESPVADVPTFGAIFRVLSGVHLVTAELQDFRDFLERHRGHRVRTEAEEGGDAFGEDDEWDEEELEDGDDDGVDRGDDDDDDDDEWDVDDEASEAARPTYSLTRYRAACESCGAEFTTSNDYPFVPFQPSPISTQAVGAFQEEFVLKLWDFSYRADPLLDDDLENLSEFLGEHAEHRLTARLEAASES